MSPALTQSQAATSGPLADYMAKSGVKSGADATVSRLSDSLEGLREDSSLRDIANMEGIKNVGKKPNVTKLYGSHCYR